MRWYQDIIDELDDASMISPYGYQGGASYRTTLGNGPRGKAQLIKVLSTTASTVTAAQQIMPASQANERTTGILSQ